MAEHHISLFSWTCCFCGTANDPASTTTTTTTTTTSSTPQPTLATLTTAPHALRCRLCAKAPCPTCNVSADALGPPTQPTTLYMKLASPELCDLAAHGYICPYCGAAAVLSDAASLLERAAHGVAVLAPSAQAATRFERHGHRRWHVLEPVLPRCALCARRVTRPGERLDFWLVRQGAGREVLARRWQGAVVKWWGAAGGSGRADAAVTPGLLERLASGAGAWDTWRTVSENGKAVHAAGLFLLVLCAAAA
ncbi:uncharacterized protein J3D65DRAFT_141431 [Phyllosticta citribraziliensis]|uniref:Uncharacterized protein n=1 Tax=Phyllosticta citribraziliensis TaxID=989973 RepID=A0ABR1L6Q9_9PEZI